MPVEEIYSLDSKHYIIGICISSLSASSQAWEQGYAVGYASFSSHRLHIPSEVTVTEEDVTAFLYRDAQGQDIPIEGWKFLLYVLDFVNS